MAQRVFAALVLLACSWIAPAAGAQDFDLACPTDEELRVVELINDERAARGLDPLALDLRLGAAALRHSEDMADGCFLSHTGSDGSSPGTRIAEAGYSPWSGEVAGADHSEAADHRLLLAIAASCGPRSSIERHTMAPSSDSCAETSTGSEVLVPSGT